MSRLDEIRLMTRVSRLYYEKKLRQSRIASQLDLSQATISRLLKRAEREKIVRTVVNIPSGVYSELEEVLQQRFDLKEVIVADCVNENDDEILRSLGSAAAYYLETTIKDNEIIGLSSWSSTLLAMVNSMQPVKCRETQVVQLLGGVGNPSAEVHANHLTRRLAELVGGRAEFLPAAGIVESADMKRMVMQDSYVKETFGLYNHVSLALVGIGALEPSKLLASSGNRFSSVELKNLRQMGAVGDICLRFFDAQGVPVFSPLNDRVLGISLDNLKKVKRCVAIAGGKRKREAICAALRGGLINVLITDRFTAENIVNEKNKTNW